MKKRIYTQPEAEVFNVSNEGFVCQSGGGSGTLPGGPGDPEAL